MKHEHLFVNGEYEPYNQWNGVVRTNAGDDTDLTTTNHGCIAHLAQVNNKLTAEVNIAAQATVIRKRNNGDIIVDPVELCKCSQHGNPGRNSDPMVLKQHPKTRLSLSSGAYYTNEKVQIASQINALARDGNKISIADPVAIYMKQFDTSKFGLDVDGSGENPEDIPAGTFTWVRGNIEKGMGLRLHIEVPRDTIGTGANAGRQLDVSDILDSSNQHIRYGAQFADDITMTVNGVVIPNSPVADPQKCCGCDANVQFSPAAAGQAFVGRV
ncbi:hypothetical protein GGS26DRAFT_551345 [Hypomontagnella submonticulosa]|nr:hypothetical protein GGS26DRAFT_551345 [Hypomontagnella submonticulosa]